MATTSTCGRGTDPLLNGSVAPKIDTNVHAGGVDKDVTFVDADPSINDQIDAVYRTKYRHHGGRYVNPMVSPEARAATCQWIQQLHTFGLLWGAFRPDDQICVLRSYL